MKKLLSFLICTALILSIIPTAVFAAGETGGQCGDNLTWSYNTETATLTISGTGDMDDYGYGYDYSPSPWYQYHSSIKNVSIGNNVTSIGDWAFYNCTGLTSITIPDSVTTIGDYAFYYCTGITSIIIGKNVATIGCFVFGDCINLNSLTLDTKNEKYYLSGNCIIEKDTNKLIFGFKNSNIPYGITEIGDSAFSYCTGLTSITIPDSVTTIGGAAFFGCEDLTSITIPNSVTTIGDRAFFDCTGLTSITIPDSVTTIGGGAFYSCRGLTSITILNGVTNIGSGAFSSCSGLTSITIPNSVTSIGREAFYYCISLKKIYYLGSKEEWNRINLQNSCIPSDAEIIYNAAGCDANIHSLSEWIAEVPETCTKDGVKEHYECSVCHKYFDKDKNEITDLAISAHHTPVLLKKIPLTCTTDGYDIVKCSSCGYRYTVNYVAATGHKFGEWVSEIPATCTEDGVKGHYECSVCHKYFDKDKEEITDTSIPAAGHSFGEWILRIPETCTESGVREHYECSVCHKYFDKDKNEITDLVIPAHHDPSLIKTTAPTCTTDGYDTVKCLNCKLIYNINYVPATGHSFGDWTVAKKLTCTDDRVEIRRCGKCDETETRITKAKGHKQGELVKHQNATCTKDNGDYYKCLTCGETYFVLGFAKNGHLFIDGECIDCGIAESDVPFDIDLDCAVSATDLTYLKRILLSNKTAECDPNGDGKLNILDLIALKKRLAKK